MTQVRSKGGSPSISPFFNKVQKACLPGIWSQGVSFVRVGAVIQDSPLLTLEMDEWVFRVRVADKPVSHKVTLWPEDEDWFCDCQGRNEVCSHVAAVLIALKAGISQGTCAEVPSLAETSKAVSGQLNYRFARKDGKLVLERWLVFRARENLQQSQKEQLLTETLVSFVGGVGSGRIQAPTLAVTREDYGVDLVLNENGKQDLDPLAWIALFKAMASCSHLFLDGEPVSVSSKPLRIRVAVSDEGTGFRLKQVDEPWVSEAFTNGVVLCAGVLRALEAPLLSPEEKRILLGKGTYYSDSNVKYLVTEILPRLEKKISIQILSQRLPQARRVVPQIVLQLEKSLKGDLEVLTVIPAFKYPVSQGSTTDILVSDPEEEKRLIRKLQMDLQLSPGQKAKFEGELGVDFLLRAQEWELSGTGLPAFSLHGELNPKIEINSDGFRIQFGSSRGEGAADPDQVFRAWRENKNYVSLLGGGWAPLPKDWLTRYAERVEELLAFKSVSQAVLPPYLIPEVAQLCREMGQVYPDTYKKLEEQLNHVDGISEAELPVDLKATLRPYQRQGINWLCFLRAGNMGAMLADDMGLGKTLQALCAIRGRTLIVCPTSVLFSWSQQIEQFRPGLSYSVYYGNQRQWNSAVQVTLTSYGLMRMDRDLLNRQKWDTVVLDEAQVIRNPESQVTRAVHTLRADFRLALSGTPLENRLEDLWSQFQFVNPGLLGTLEGFQERYANPMSRGDQKAGQRLRAKVKPFILRRLKRDVAIDLPSRTEIVLECELSAEEREIYNALLVSTRQEVLEKLEGAGKGQGGSIFAVLELLLRLRQACCHVALVPGTMGQKTAPSSKIELLLQTLTDSIACGHRSLVFSQWTSYLDLIEPQFIARGISFLRLDGSTQNREQVVAQFQGVTGPSVFLISLKAGGIGITLTAADHIFLMDPWWNPAVEDQAADRAHRIGQTNPVLIHRLVARETIEERILDLQKSKRATAASVLEEAGSAASLTREDLLALLN